MADIINYDVTIDPSTPQVTLGLSATPSTLTVTVASLGDFSLSVKPSTGTIVAGVVAGSIVGFFAGFGVGAILGGAAGVGLVYAVAKMIEDELPGPIRTGVQGQTDTVDLGQLGYSFSVESVQVNVSAATLTLGTYQGMLQATGTVKVS